MRTDKEVAMKKLLGFFLIALFMWNLCVPAMAYENGEVQLSVENIIYLAKNIHVHAI